MRFRIVMNCDSFQDPVMSIAHILRQAAEDVEMHADVDGSARDLRDDDGQVVGHWMLTQGAT